MLFQAIVLKVLVCLSILSQSAICSPLVKREPTCQNIVIPVAASAENLSIPSNFSLDPETLLSQILGLLFSLFIPTTTFNIAARYCEPEVQVASRANTLQLLVHGATYDRNYWSGEGEPGQGYDGDTYSWIAYASKQGYPTLSIDRLGSGISTRPDPITTVQDPLQAEIHYQLIALIRANKAKLPRAFNKIIYVGHSFGSLIGHLMNVNHPNAVEASLLTGFSKTLINELPGLVTSFNLLPADTVLSQFSNLRVGYLTPDNEQGAIWTFFQGSYDPAFAEYVYSIRQTITIGEILSALPIAQATAHTNPVFVISGELDNIFCNPTGTQLTVASCGGAGGILDQTRTVYPLADLQGNYYWEGLADMGHCWQQHSNAIQGYADSHNWMAARGF